MSPTTSQILRLADEHIRHYRRLISKSGMGVRAAECKTLLHLWENVKEKGGQNLSPQQMDELRDAVTSGDYDDILEKP